MLQVRACGGTESTPTPHQMTGVSHIKRCLALIQELHDAELELHVQHPVHDLRLSQCITE